MSRRPCEATAREGDEEHADAAAVEAGHDGGDEQRGDECEGQTVGRTVMKAVGTDQQIEGEVDVGNTGEKRCGGEERD
jgi:hypothetical protein